MSRSGPWGIGAVLKEAHSGVRSQPLRSGPQRGDMVKCGPLQTEGCVKELADVRELVLFIIIVVDLHVCLGDALYL